MTAAEPLERLVREAREALAVLRGAGQRCLVDTEPVSDVAERLERALEAVEPIAGKVMTCGALARLWDVSPSTVRGWIEDGVMPGAFNAGRGTVARWRIPIPVALRFAQVRQKRSQPTGGDRQPGPQSTD